jgi:hypothetical protein
VFILSFSDPARVYIFFYTDTKKLTTPASRGGMVTAQGLTLSSAESQSSGQSRDVNITAATLESGLFLTYTQKLLFTTPA